MEASKNNNKEAKKVTPKQKSLEDLEEDQNLKEVLIHTSKILEEKNRQKKLGADEKTML